MLALSGGSQGRRTVYRLDWDGQGMNGERFFNHLVDVEQLAGHLPGACRVESDKQETAPKDRENAEKGISRGTCRVAGRKRP